MRILALLTDAYGGYGGISVANRHFLRGLCSWDACDEVVAVPLFMPNAPEPMPDNLVYRSEGTGNRAKFVASAIDAAIRQGPFDAIWCGHIDLMAFAAAIKTWVRAPLILHMHGIETWDPPQKLTRRVALHAVDAFISVSDVTRQRFLEWAPLSGDRGFVLPNTIDFSPFSPGLKRPDLLDEYNLHGRDVLMTMGRLVSRKRAKGFDKILEVLPDIAKERPRVTYLIAGKGPDRTRLEHKAVELGIRDRVVFTGFVPEDEKADYYRLADLYVMPSQGEGFGLVLLEAMACGIPVIASARDGSREAVLNGELGDMVDPCDSGELRRVILNHLPSSSGPDLGKLHDHFGAHAFGHRLKSVLCSILFKAPKLDYISQLKSFDGKDAT
jgi:glycosyltransferase involved in cell wall biosynthesis